MLPISDHNHFYLTEDNRNSPKEYFKFLVQRAAARLTAHAPRVLDIGCATGDFLCYVRSLYPQSHLTGMDVTWEFLSKAEHNVPGAEFLVGDIYSGAGLPGERFDVVFMSGVNYLFADYEPWLRNLTSITRGAAYVFGVFNPEDLDVRAMVSRPGDKSDATPWNLISQKSISLFLDRLELRYRFWNWELPVPMPRTHDDPLRSWTIGTPDGRFLVVNGMQLVHRFAALEIEVASDNP